MNRRVIALMGRAEIGKTETMRLFVFPTPAILNAAGWQQIGPQIMHGNGVDFTDIFQNADGVLLGISSAGDNYGEVQRAIARLAAAGCVVILTACRTWGGTHTAMREFTNDIRFVRKTVITANNAVQRAQANNADTLQMLNLV